ncbi:hypothetical protein [Anthocerotibacter panamensis]|uniref:hypothetical protein n=1 Tax=Anthocerotibacter panamensis TaxID=2857077 RepID=UPI001C4088F2|nr:hypothetical protein [Anthocerotibacter panamensis]
MFFLIPALLTILLPAMTYPIHLGYLGELRSSNQIFDSRQEAQQAIQSGINLVAVQLASSQDVPDARINIPYGQRIIQVGIKVAPETIEGLNYLRIRALAKVGSAQYLGTATYSQDSHLLSHARYFIP